MLPCRPFVLASLLAMPITAQTPLRLDLVASGLSRPVLVVAPPGDLHRLFLVEQTGRIRVVRDGALLPTPFLDLTTDATFVFSGEAGLLGLAFHPSYTTNGQFFVFHGVQPWPTNTLRRFRVSATNPDVADPASSLTLLVQPMVYGNHNGGMLAFGPDGYLYVSIGDGGSTPPTWPDDPQNHAQRGDSLLGKILRLDVDNPQPPLAYGIPASNPFVGPGDPRDEIWALGLRNPWRFGFDRLTGDLWIADVGGNREEVDFELAGSTGGRNYGWSCMSGTYCTGSAVCACYSPVLTMPLHEYPTGPNGQAIIGGFVYRGAAIPDLRGTYFHADHMRAELWSFRRGVGGTVTQLTDRTAELAPPAGHVILGPTGFGEDAYGELYVCDLSGGVFKVVPNGPSQAGVSAYGIGTPGCTGAHSLSAIGSPVLGHPAFELRCTQAPANFVGIMVIASHADIAGSDPLGLGFLAHVQVTSPLLLLLTMTSDAAGIGTFSFAIPPTPSLAGYTLHAQGLWLWPPAVCSPSPFGWSSSPGLTITLQP